MPMIDFTQKQSEADGQLSRFTLKADGKDESAFIYECDVVFVIDSVADARTLASIVPGAVEVFERAGREDDNWKFNTTVNPDLAGVRATLSHAKRGKVAVDGGVEVKSLRLRASKKAVAATAKLVFGGQTAAVAANLAPLLRAACSLSLEKLQGVIPFPSAKGAPEPQKGDLVVAWGRDVQQHYVGRLVEATEERIALDNFGDEYSIDPEEVTAVLKLDGDVTALRKSFVSRCKRRDVQPMWDAVILAAAESDSGLLSGGGTLVLTPEVIERAVARIESGDAELLPPEPGERAEG